MVELIKCFLPEEKKLGECGYWVATVEAAVEYIRGKDYEELDGEEEEDGEDEEFGKERLEGLLAKSGFLG